MIHLHGNLVSLPFQIRLDQSEDMLFADANQNAVHILMITWASGFLLL